MLKGKKGWYELLPAFYISNSYREQEIDLLFKHNNEIRDFVLHGKKGY